MKKYPLFLAILFLVFFIGTFRLVAQTSSPNVVADTAPAKVNVQVKGLVIDSLTSETLPYATLKITTQSNPDQAVKLLATNESGKFDVKLEKAGDYLLTVQYTGKAPSVKPFKVENTDKQLDLGKIYVSDNQQLEEVVVTAIKPLVKVDLDKITYSTEDDPDSKTNNVLEMLKKVPMITVDAEEKIELKGSSNYKVYLDGKPSNMISNNPSQVLKSMPANTVKSIEVITDPGAKYDAEGVNGIINIVTNKQPIGGYTGSVNTGVNTMGGYNAGAYLSLKYGKIGFTGNYDYFYHKSPSAGADTYSELYNGSDDQRYLYKNGTNDFDYKGQYGSGELSYEIDTLNLLSMSFNRFVGNSNSNSDYSVEMQDITRKPYYQYNQSSNNKGTFGSTDINIDYQRTFKKKDELLTSSYQFSLSPNDSESQSVITPLLNYKRQQQQLASDAGSKEHTFQIDYANPLTQIHSIEGGAKYIIRLNESNSYHDTLNFSTNQWVPIPSYSDEFKHRQDILSGYLGYNLKYNKIGFKAGLRAEETKLTVDYPLNTEQNFESNYFNLIPSATFSYQVQQMQNLRLGYNLRIQRPGIWYLNPYINSSDPRFVTQGNPDLDVEKSHNLNLNYGIFKQKFNVNASLTYNFTNNSIQQVTTIRNNSTTNQDYYYTTYQNIGKSSSPGLFLYGNITPTPKIRIYANLSGSYMDIKANDDSGMANSGFQGRVFAGFQYTFPLDFVLSLNGGYGSPSINIQGENSGFYYTSIGLNKSFLNKKLTLSLAGSELFSKYREYGSESTRPGQYYTKINNQYESRSLRFSVSYNFGEMKQQIKKVSRGINNDDSKAGEGNTGGGAGGPEDSK